MKTIRVVAAIIYDAEGRVFCTQRGYGEWQGWWEFPGGKIEADEAPQEALRREIREELNTEVAVGERLTTVEYDYPAFHLSMQCFRCRLAGEAPTLLEHKDAQWLRPDQLGTLQWLPADRQLLGLV